MRRVLPPILAGCLALSAFVATARDWRSELPLKELGFKAE
jgi:hypothetical protein